GRAHAAVLFDGALLHFIDRTAERVNRRRDGELLLLELLVRGRLALRDGALARGRLLPDGLFLGGERGVNRALRVNLLLDAPTFGRRGPLFGQPGHGL